MPTTWTGRTSPTTTWIGRPQVTSGDTYILTELSEILTTESGLSLVYEYGIVGTTWTGRVTP